MSIYLLKKGEKPLQVIATKVMEYCSNDLDKASNTLVLLPNRLSVSSFQNHLIGMETDFFSFPRIIPYDSLSDNLHLFLSDNGSATPLLPRAISTVELRFLVISILRKQLSNFSLPLDYVQVSCISDEVISFLANCYEYPFRQLDSPGPEDFFESIEFLEATPAQASALACSLQEIFSEVRARGRTLSSERRKFAEQEISQNIKGSKKKIFCLFPDSGSLHTNDFLLQVQEEIELFVCERHPAIEQEESISVSKQGGKENVRLLEYPTQEEEADAVAIMVREALEKDPSISMCIVASQQALVSQVKNRLKTWGISVKGGERKQVRYLQEIKLFMRIAALLKGEDVYLSASICDDHLTEVPGGAEGLKLQILKMKSSLGIGSITERKHSFLELLKAHHNLYTSLLPQKEERSDGYRDIKSLIKEVENFSLAKERKWSLEDYYGEIEELLEISTYPASRIEEPSHKVHILSPPECFSLTFDKVILTSMNEEECFSSPRQNLLFKLAPIEKEFLLWEKELTERSIKLQFYRLTYALEMSSDVVATRSLSIEGKDTTMVRILEPIYRRDKGEEKRISQLLHHLYLNDTEEYRYKYHSCPRPTIDFVPLKDRPRKFSVTAIEKLMMNPYLYYLKYILKIEPLDHPKALSLHKEVGEWIHAVLAEYKIDWNSINARYPEYCNDLFYNRDVPEAVRKPFYLFWGKPYLEAVERWFFSNLSPDKEHSTILREVKGERSVEINGEKTRIMAIADRIDISPEGKATVMDYKTGKVPSTSDVASGLSPQLLIEKWILEGGGFPSVEAGKLEEIKMLYVSLDRKEGAQEIQIPAEYSTALEKKLSRLLGKFLSEGSEYSVCVRKKQLDKNKKYRHILRMKEWT